MSLTDQVYAQAAVLAGELTERQLAFLQALCRSSSGALAARLRDGLTPEDCKADFIAAASLMALAALDSVDEDRGLEQITAGDLTIRKGSRAAAANCLRTQADLMMAPYMKDAFSFRGV